VLSFHPRIACDHTKRLDVRKTTVFSTHWNGGREGRCAVKAAVDEPLPGASTPPARDSFTREPAPEYERTLLGGVREVFLASFGAAERADDADSPRELKMRLTVRDRAFPHAVVRQLFHGHPDVNENGEAPLGSALGHRVDIKLSRSDYRRVVSDDALRAAYVDAKAQLVQRLAAGNESVVRPGGGAISARVPRPYVPTPTVTPVPTPTVSRRPATPVPSPPLDGASPRETPEVSDCESTAAPSRNDGATSSRSRSRPDSRIPSSEERSDETPPREPSAGSGASSGEFEAAPIRSFGRERKRAAAARAAD